MAYVSAMADRREVFARLIRDGRARRQWSQQQLADEANVGRRTVIRWETADDGTPDADSLNAVVDALRIDRMQAYIALGWLPAGDMARIEPPPRTWADYIRSIARLDDRPYERRMAMILDALDEWDGAGLTAADEFRSQLDEIGPPEEPIGQDERRA